MAIGQLLTHLFVPHHTNNHRSKVLHTDALLAYVLLFALFNFGLRIVHRELPDILGYATDIHTEQLLAATNAQRASAGLSQLRMNNKLSQAAAAKAADMLAKNYWAHNSPAGATPWDFIAGSGYRYAIAGENLAKNFSTSQGVVDAWMASPTHRDNIVKSGYREVGFAVVNGVLQGEETTLIVQMFGSPTDSLAAAPEPTKAPLITKVEAAENPVPVVTDVPAIATTEERAAPQPAGSTFGNVTITPAINIPTLTRDIVFIFAGVLLGVLVLDLWVVSRRKIVRVAGHNIAHFLFLTAVVVAAGSVSRGVLL